MGGGGCKKVDLSSTQGVYVQYQYFLFYILLIWGCVRTQRTPLRTGLRFFIVHNCKTSSALCIDIVYI